MSPRLSGIQIPDYCIAVVYYDWQPISFQAFHDYTTDIESLGGYYMVPKTNSIDTKNDKKKCKAQSVILKTTLALLQYNVLGVLYYTEYRKVRRAQRL